MKKFVVMYRVPVETMQEWMKGMDSEKMKAEGAKMEADMNAWMAKNAKSIIDKGMPLGKNTRMDASGAKPLSNDLAFYNVVSAESLDAVVAMHKDNPHMQIPTAFLDIMEITREG